MPATVSRAKLEPARTAGAAPPQRAADAGQAAPQSIVKRAVFLLLAGLLLGLAALGAVLPVLPTTPFVLLASYFLLKSWPAAHDRLLRSRLFGGILRDWQEHRAVRRHVKTKSIVTVGIVVGLSIWWFGYSLPWAAAIAGMALVGIGLILKLPEVK